MCAYGHDAFCAVCQTVLTKDTGAASIGDKSAWHVSGQTGIGLTQDKQNQAFPENTAVRTE